MDDARLARIALQGTVAFMSAEHLVRDSMGGTFAIVSETLGASNNLCPGESFETQPAAATCSGVLVGDQLMLTAGHCIPEDATCGDSLLVFDYAITSPGRAIALDPEAIYRCKAIVARSHRIDPDGRRWDHGFIELDRPVSLARRPVEVASEPLPVGSPVTVIGYPGGLPVKSTRAHIYYTSGRAWTTSRSTAIHFNRAVGPVLRWPRSARRHRREGRHRLRV